MRYLLDTNVISETRRPAPDPRVLTWLDAQPAEALAISTLTLFELEVGRGRLARRDPARGAGIATWIDGVRSVFAGRTLPVDDAVARTAAAVHVPDPRPVVDAFLAATALAHDLVLVTRNTTDFTRTGALLLDPWREDPQPRLPRA